MNQTDEIEGQLFQRGIPISKLNWNRQLSNLKPKDDYISYSKKNDDEDATSSSKNYSLKNLSILEDKDDSSIKWRNSIGGTYSGTYRTKADSGPEISWMENSCYTERKSRQSHESNPRMKE